VTAFRDFLMRFRPAGSPGPAAPTGVPADRSADLAAELDPVLSRLGQAETEAQQIREAAAQLAEQNRRAAADKAEEIVRLARIRAREVRTESAAHAYGLAKTEAAECLAESERKAALLKSRAQQRMASLVDRALADVGQIGASAAPAGGRPRWERDGSRG
jgi:vacuolar-type H+-ATPase subunit H